MHINCVFGIAINAWFDGWPYNNAFGSGMLHAWVIQHIDYIAIMAYRNRVQGSNGVLSISQGEIDYGATATPEYRNVNLIKQNSRYQRPNGLAGIVIGVETDSTTETFGSSGESISYHGQTRTYFDAQMTTLVTTFGVKSSFAGRAIHYLRPYMQLV